MQYAISWRSLRHNTSKPKQEQTAAKFFNGTIAAFVLFTLFIALAQLT